MEPVNNIMPEEIPGAKKYLLFDCVVDDAFASTGICLRAVCEPTLEEATEFLKEEIETLKDDFAPGKITAMHLTTYAEAACTYNMCEVEARPVFGEEPEPAEDVSENEESGDPSEDNDPYGIKVEAPAEDESAAENIKDEVIPETIVAKNATDDIEEQFDGAAPASKQTSVLDDILQSILNTAGQ